MFAANQGCVGWQPDIPDPRDLTLRHGRASTLLRRLPVLRRRPARVDMRAECGEVRLSGGISSSVHACVDLLTLSERQASGLRLEPSRQFVHYTSTRLARSWGVHPDSLRTVWKALVQFGAPAEPEWPGREAGPDLDGAPDAFAYSAARSYASLHYIRLDPRQQSADETLELTRWFLAGGFGVALGIPLCTAISPDGEIGFPTSFDVIRGGQAVLAVGYDDERRVRSDRGCLLVRSCWGREWGEGGYGWLPYRYVHRHLTSDFWIILRPEWINSGEFRRPATLEGGK